MNDTTKKDNRGYLYPNKNKNKPSQPDFTGKVMVNQKEMKISAWENKTPEGNKYLSIAFSVPLAEIDKKPIPESIATTNNYELDIENMLKDIDNDNPFDNDN